MTAQHIIKLDTRRNELTADQLAVLEEDRKRWERLGTGAQLDEWLAFGNGLMIRRKLAQDIAGTQDLENIHYKRAFKAQMELDRLYDPTTTTNTTKAIFTAVMFFYEEPAQQRLDVLAEIRRDMTAGERARLNSPITARQRVERVLRDRGVMAPTKAETIRASKPSTADLQRDLEAAKAHAAELEASQDRGSLFDLKRDTPESIANTIVGTVPGRAEKIARAILAKLKAAKAPAG